jgi:hypothetical protein
VRLVVRGALPALMISAEPVSFLVCRGHETIPKGTPL